jgi:hypothetical protein
MLKAYATTLLLDTELSSGEDVGSGWLDRISKQDANGRVIFSQANGKKEK